MSDPDGDPTADFLAEVRTEETPWRTDRPADAPASEPVERPRSRALRAVGEAAPYVQAGLFAAWVATSVADAGDGGGQAGDVGG
ncbi:hypothetical protein, partial [Amycolatopsis jejuensis]|uniref:hypothetical protein n=1 Tax=Amycolatopsis jejuensis TaxID=330084 RepID=UPI0005251D28